jgi:hypothetical protein
MHDGGARGMRGECPVMRASPRVIRGNGRMQARSCAWGSTAVKMPTSQTHRPAHDALRLADNVGHDHALIHLDTST